MSPIGELSPSTRYNSFGAVSGSRTHIGLPTQIRTENLLTPNQAPYQVGLWADISF